MSERLSWSEAEAVVRAYRTEHGMASDVDVATLAATLGTSPAEVRRLAGRQRRFIDRSGVTSAALAFGILAVGVFATGPGRLGHKTHRLLSPLHSVSQPIATSLVIVPDPNGRVHVLNTDGDPNPTGTWSYPSEERATLLLPDEKTL